MPLARRDDLTYFEKLHLANIVKRHNEVGVGMRDEFTPHQAVIGDIGSLHDSLEDDFKQLNSNFNQRDWGYTLPENIAKHFENQLEGINFLLAQLVELQRLYTIDLKLTSQETKEESK